MKISKRKILSIIVIVSLIVQSIISFNYGLAFADETSQITIDIGSKSVNLGDTSAVSIKLDKEYNQESIVLKQICYDVFQETTLNYNSQTNTYEGTIKYEVEPECKKIWSIEEIKVGNTILDSNYLSNKGLNLSDYDVTLNSGEIYYTPKVRTGISTVATTAYSNYTVVLDPGHGGVAGSGYNWGGATAVNDTLWEKDYNLQTAQATATYLRNKGVNVIMTRDSDIYLSLAQRSTMINHINPDLTLSIHYNSYNEGYNGTTAYHKVSEPSNGIGRKLAENVVNSIVKRFGFANLGAKTYTCINNYGKTEDYLHMIREPHGNVSLVECCYLSDVGDQAKVNTQAKRTIVGQQIGKGIIETLDYMIENNIKPNTKVQKVQNLKAELQQDNSVNLSWDSVVGSEGYQIFRGNQLEGNFEFIGETASTSFVDNSRLEEGVEYFYRVKSYKSSNGLKYYSSFSDAASVYVVKQAEIASDVYAKKYASSTSENVALLKAGTTVKIVGDEGEWYKIIYNNSYAYIPKSSIKLAVENVKYIGVVTAEGVKRQMAVLKEAPSNSARDIKSLSAKTELQIVEEILIGSGWYKVIYENGYAYILVEALEIESIVGEPDSYGITTMSVNMRKGPDTSYEQIVTIPTSTKIVILDTATNGWYKILYLGKTGYVSNRYVTKIVAEPEIPSTTEKEYGTTTANVNMRYGPGTSYERITTLSAGTKVEILGTASNGWYKVIYAGNTGYVSNQYVKKDTESGTTEPETPVTPPTTEKEYGTTTANVNMRKGPSTSYEKITTVPVGTKVEILDVASTGWYKVVYAGNTGYISNQYIKKTTTGGTTEPETPVTPPTTEKEYGTTTANVNMRKGPSTSYEKITTVPVGTKVEILDVASTGWYKVVYAGNTGYISNQYIKKSTTGGTTEPETPVTPPTSEKKYGMTTANVNMRKGPSTSYGKIITVPANTKIEILGTASTGWYKVTYSGNTGYLSNQYVKIL